MSVIYNGGRLSLPDTLDCGQAFRWQDKGNGWEGTAMGRQLRLSQEGENIIFHCSQEEYDNIWRSYFDLDTDYAAIQAQLSELSPVLKQAIDFAPGIRILRQDPFEVICTFILTQNCNIPRIKGMVERLCQSFGTKIADGVFDFPTAETLAQQTVESLAPVRAGFRAKYLLEAARMVAGGQIPFEDIKSGDLDFGRKALQRIYGVGPKVAECVLLFGFYKTAAFPQDVWIKRAMAELFPGKGPEMFGTEAGLAQQYIFHYIRNRNKDVEAS